MQQSELCREFAVGGSVAAEGCCIFDSHLLPAQLYLTGRETVK